jgi:hypothetical protein
MHGELLKSCHIIAGGVYLHCGKKKKAEMALQLHFRAPETQNFSYSLWATETVTETHCFGAPKTIPQNKRIGNRFRHPVPLSFSGPKTIPKTFGFANGFGAPDNIPEILAFGRSELIPETFRFSIIFRSPKTFDFRYSFELTYSISKFFSFRYVFGGPDSSDFPE